VCRISLKQTHNKTVQRSCKHSRLHYTIVMICLILTLIDGAKPLCVCFVCLFILFLLVIIFSYFRLSFFFACVCVCVCVCVRGEEGESSFFGFMFVS
jgi:cell division protein FtsW (lipid II flippase)